MSRVLTLSNECFSEQSSNGRTMAQLLRDFSPEELAQFYLHGLPDEKVCKNYFCVSDKQALNAFLCKRQKKPAQKMAPTKAIAPAAKEKAPAPSIPAPAAPAEPKIVTPQMPVPQKAPEKVQRSCKNLVLRDIIWRTNRWWKKDFTAFLREFQPEVVLLQAGDSPFMYAIARKIARKYHAKLAMFNTESYVLKKILYAGAKEKSFWHLLLRHRLRVQYRKFMKRADYCTYNTEWLEAAYQEAYPHPGKSCTFYVSTQLTPTDHATQDSFDVTYCGNLGVGRTAPLMQVAKVLGEAIPEATLHIYGKFLSQKEQAAFLQLPNVAVHGVIPYAQVPETLSASTLVFHCEHPKRVEDLRYAFSTKIADSLACGRPFLVFALRDYPFVQYLAEAGCAHIASTPEELKELLLRCKDPAFCDFVLPNAKTLAYKNHNMQHNAERMHEVLCKL